MAWRAKLQRSMWPLAVVVGGVPGQDNPQVVFAEDQDAVSEFGSGGADEAFGVAVGSGTSWWDLHGLDAGAGENGVERGGELAGAVADEEPEDGSAVVEVHQQVAGLLGGPVGFQYSATGAGLRLQAARSYSLINPPKTGRA